jgi:hypothetical protein
MNMKTEEIAKTILGVWWTLNVYAFTAAILLFALTVFIYGVGLLFNNAIIAAILLFALAIYICGVVLLFWIVWK